MSIQSQCVVCGDSQTIRVIDKLKGKRFDIDRCLNCGLEFLEPQPTWEEIQSIYSSDYYAPWDMTTGEHPATGKMKRLTFKRRLSELSLEVDEGPVLDIGTATGFFLDEVAADPRYQPYRVEVSEYAGKIAQSEFGADPIRIGTIETAPFPEEFFSAVAMSDLIEHGQDPHPVVKCVHSLLRPRGGAR